MIVRALERRAETVNPRHPKDPGLVELFNFRGSASGVDVDDRVAMTYSAVFACVKVLAETMASVPFAVFMRNGRSRERDPRHPLYPVLHHRPNPEMTSAELIETMQGQIGLRGNGLANIVRNGAGDVTELWPLRADRTRLVRRNGKLWYIVRLPGGEERPLPKRDVFHVRGLGANGLWGYSPVDQAREAIGLGLATERYGARFFANDGAPGGALRHPEKLGGAGNDPDARTAARNRLRADWAAMHEGLENKHRVAILEEGMEWQSIGVDPRNSQFLEQRVHQLRDVARWYRVPLHLILDYERATFSNIETMSLEFVKYTMLPWFRKWEQASLRDLFRPSEVDHFAEFVLEGLLRGDSKSRAEFYRTLWNIGAINDNEIRERENLNPREGGDTYFVPLNTIPADQAGQFGGGGGEPGAGDRSSVRTSSEKRTEQRQRQQSAEGRRRLALVHQPVFRDAASRWLSIERNQVMQQARKQLTRRDAQSFSLWLEEFYGEPHQERIRTILAPALAAYSELIAADAGQVVATEPDGEALAAFVAGYVGVAAARHAGSSRAQLQEVVEAGEGDPIAGLEQKFDEWRDGLAGGTPRAEKIASRESFEANGAVSRWTWVTAGVTRLVWVTFGDNCPFCQRMDGRVVEMSQHFVGKGETFEAPGRAPMRTRSVIKHPPLHAGCDCGVAPG